MAVAAPGKLGRLRAEIGTRRSTPRVIEFVAALMVVLAIVTFLTSYAVISRISDVVFQIGYATKPSVVLAEKLSVALADMDAAITNSSLGSRNSWWRYVTDADSVVTMAVDASRNLDTNNVEAKSLRRVLSNLRNYYQFVGGANALATDSGTDQRLPLAMTLWASHSLRQDVIPETENMARNTDANLDAIYDEYRDSVLASVVKAMVPAALLLLLMLGGQFFLAMRTHRLFNVPLALGTGMLAMFMIWFSFVSLTDAATLQAAKEDSFATVLHLYRAKVVSYLMKADESMWLLEQRKARADYAQSFAKGSQAILSIGNANQLALSDPDRPAAPVDQAAIEQLKTALAAAERKAEDGDTAGAAQLTPPNIPGYLGDELNHVTRHPAERKAATAAVSYFLRHIDIDTRLRSLESTGHHAEAVRLCIGENEGGSNWAFLGMNTAIDEIIALNDAEFEADIRAMAGHVGRMIQALAGAIAGAVLFGGLGLWQRYAEYR
jgi:hypothetical protein